MTAYEKHDATLVRARARITGMRPMAATPTLGAQDSDKTKRPVNDEKSK